MTDRIDTAKEREWLREMRRDIRRFSVAEELLGICKSYLTAIDAERAENERLREALEGLNGPDWADAWEGSGP